MADVPLTRRHAVRSACFVSPIIQRGYAGSRCGDVRETGVNQFCASRDNLTVDRRGPSGSVRFEVAHGDDAGDVMSRLRCHLFVRFPVAMQTSGTGAARFDMRRPG